MHLPLPFPSSLRSSLLLLCGAAAVLPALAQDSEMSAQYTACMDKAGGVTLSMVECIVAEHGRQDKRLNTVYTALMAALEPPRKKQLQAAQRLWLQYREANCSFYMDPEGGSLARVAANSCQLQMTAQRAQELAGLKPMR
ncbi:lysozyme inhibitor LprI family protein [Comamonas endophytica]|uniref:Lysozyme inhibitor LprI family protein n=1 Tax=Comamonas endophytica TaxID=2949090 RepID=A0ABY6GFZ4_9BURK|nr:MULTISPECIES: lysozyme inhibitor LprI family protein [unclassified Acidovorax]MCD2513394.1 lysozyme inhibitor LprI family protein [Acidovorax sp. D4N7]UYG53823.1 lysozyme inhibitor LprI family protein [Acidovorax sp. 5MLIR]